MTTSSELFDFSPDPDLDDIDLDLDVDEDQDQDIDEDYFAPTAGNTDAIGVTGDKNPQVKQDTRTPEQKIADLFNSMKPHRRTLLRIMEFCIEPAPAEAVNALVEEIQQAHFSVFSAASICRHLEAAGAICRTNADGSPFVEGENEPEVTVIDGVEYLQASEPPQVHWMLTPAGCQALDADDPVANTFRLLCEEARYIPVYRLILQECSREGGISTKEIAEIVDSHPLLQEPRYWTSRFTTKLQDAEALIWDKTWQITPAGAEILAGMPQGE